MDIDLSSNNLTNYLIESSKTFIKHYLVRVHKFIDSTEGIELEFIENQIELFNACFDRLTFIKIKAPVAFGIEKNLSDSITEGLQIIDLEKFYYSTKRKIEFLNLRKDEINSDTIPINSKYSIIYKSSNKKLDTIESDEIIKIKNDLKKLSKKVKIEKLNFIIQERKIAEPINKFLIENLLLYLEDIEINPEAFENTEIDKKLIPFVYDRSLDWFFNATNIPNQDLVFATYDYFNEGPRSNMFEPLFFLNFLYCQFDKVKMNFETPFKVLGFLKELPITQEENHVLIGFILKWFGGYPTNNMNPQFDTMLRLIEREFLNYPLETPEKKFCHRDMIQYVRFKELENYFNLKINNPNNEVLIPESFKSTQFKNLNEEVVAREAVKNRKPYFVEDFRLPLIEILKPYFDVKQHNLLKDLVLSSIEPIEKLLFKSQGNRLAHAFRVLINQDIITQQNKKELENWICENFTYLKDNSENPYTKKYISDIISSNSDKCKKPILKIVTNGEGKKILEKT